MTTSTRQCNKCLSLVQNIHSIVQRVLSLVRYFVFQFCVLCIVIGVVFGGGSTCVPCANPTGSVGATSPQWIQWGPSPRTCWLMVHGGAGNPSLALLLYFCMLNGNKVIPRRSPDQYPSQLGTNTGDGRILDRGIVTPFRAQSNIRIWRRNTPSNSETQCTCTSNHH